MWQSKEGGRDDNYGTYPCRSQDAENGVAVAADDEQAGG